MQIYNLPLAREMTQCRIEFSEFEGDVSALKPSRQIVKVQAHSPDDLISVRQSRMC